MQKKNARFLSVNSTMKCDNASENGTVAKRRKLRSPVMKSYVSVSSAVKLYEAAYDARAEMMNAKNERDAERELLKYWTYLRSMALLDLMSEYKRWLDKKERAETGE